MSSEVEDSEVSSEHDSVYSFDDSFQEKILSLCFRDPSFMKVTEGLIQPEFFGKDSHKVLIKIALDYYKNYKKSPHISVLSTIIKDAIADKKIRSDMIADVKDAIKSALKTDISDGAFIKEKVCEFAKHKAIEGAIIKSVGYLESGKYEEIEKEVSKAVGVGLNEEDIGIDYYDDIDRRTKERLDFASGKIAKRGITSGYKEIDDLLYNNGWGRKELSVIMGPAKGGKSMSLGEFAKNASLAGYNVFYATCEVSRDIIVDRLDANITGTLMKGLKLSAEDVNRKFKAELTGKAVGKLIISEHPSGALKVSQLRRIIDSWKNRGVNFDLIVVDYADIMCPERIGNDYRDDMRRIYIDLREVAFIYDAAVLTATQTNREGMKAITAKATDVAEDINKVRTLDVMIIIAATEAEKADGEMRLVFALNRNGPSDVTVTFQQERKYLRFLKKVLKVE